MKRQHKGFTFIELIAVMTIILLLVVITVPAIHRCREIARRTQCLNNLCQLSVAIHNYEMAFSVLPPGSVNPTTPLVHKRPGYHMGWLAQITPMIDNEPLYRHTDFSVSIYASENDDVRSSMPSFMHCPSAVAAAETSGYAGCTGGTDEPLNEDNNGLLYLNSSVGYAEIRDGSSHTIVLGERVPGDTPNGFESGWLAGTSSTLRHTGTAINQWPGPIQSKLHKDLQVGGFNSPHDNNTVQVAMADGSARGISESIALDVWQNLGNRADGEIAMLQW